MNPRPLTGLILFAVLTGSAWAAVADPAQVEVVLHTDRGGIVIRLFPADAPRHVDHFLQNAAAGRFDGTTFFRVIPMGIIQGGDPLTRDPAARERYGTGGLNQLKAEINERPCRRGAVAAVLVPGNRDSAGDQFFICVTDQATLDGQYTVFGHVVAGLAVVEEISRTPADERYMATERVVLRRAEVRPIPRPAFAGTPVEELTALRAVIETSLGEIVVELTPAAAPAHVRQFLSFAREGLYDGSEFHRVVPGFVIQGGFLALRQPPLEEAHADWLRPLPLEAVGSRHVRGAVSMARGSEPDSGLDSFFICLADQPALNDLYTRFGTVVEGMEVVDRIAEQPTDGEQPRARIPIHRIRVAPAPGAGIGD